MNLLPRQSPHLSPLPPGEGQGEGVLINKFQHHLLMMMLLLLPVRIYRLLRAGRRRTQNRLSWRSFTVFWESLSH
jgi:hypothetical protein